MDRIKKRLIGQLPNNVMSFIVVILTGLVLGLIIYTFFPKNAVFLIIALVIGLILGFILFTILPRNAISSITAIIAGLAVGFIILLITNPSQAVGAFLKIISAGLSDLKNFGDVLYFATPIIMTGLSVGFASRTGLFNIGASGQFTFGAYAAILIGVRWTFLPGATHWIVAILAAVIAGALWGVIPGLLKAYFNVNEVIACIMMNYIGMFLVNYLIPLTCYDSRYNTTQPVASSAILPKLGMDKIFKGKTLVSSANSGIFIAILAAIAIYVILEKTVFGYELKASGYNSDAARYAGINRVKGVVSSMAISGALAGLGGALLYLAGSGKRITVVDELAVEGFNGIPVALLGLNNPIGIVFAGLFVSYMNVGGSGMQAFDFTSEIIEIIIATIIYFSAFSLLIKDFLQSRMRKDQIFIASGTAAGEDR